MRPGPATAGLIVAAQPALARNRSQPAILLGSVADWLGPMSYPPAAMREGAEGRVSVALGVDANGMVTDCHVLSSSGYTSLDVATCSLAKHRARFAPARDHHGKPVASTYTLPTIRWQMPHDPVPPAAPPGE